MRLARDQPYFGMAWESAGGTGWRAEMEGIQIDMRASGQYFGTGSPNSVPASPVSPGWERDYLCAERLAVAFQRYAWVIFRREQSCFTCLTGFGAGTAAARDAP